MNHNAFDATASHIRSCIEGIAGMDVDLNLLPGDTSYALE